MQYNEKKAQAHLARATQLLRESEEDLGFGKFNLRGYKERRALRKEKKKETNQMIAHAARQNPEAQQEYLTQQAGLRQERRNRLRDVNEIGQRESKYMKRTNAQMEKNRYEDIRKVRRETLNLLKMAPSLKMLREVKSGIETATNRYNANVESAKTPYYNKILEHIKSVCLDNNLKFQEESIDKYPSLQQFVTLALKYMTQKEQAKRPDRFFKTNQARRLIREVITQGAVMAGMPPAAAAAKPGQDPDAVTEPEDNNDDEPLEDQDMKAYRKDTGREVTYSPDGLRVQTPSGFVKNVYDSEIVQLPQQSSSATASYADRDMSERERAQHSYPYSDSDYVQQLPNPDPSLLTMVPYDPGTMVQRVQGVRK